MTDAMLSWLRSQIESDRAAAEAAEKASPGPWVNTGQYGNGDAWQIHGAPTEASGEHWDDEKQDVVPTPSDVATAQFEDGGGVWTREAADHIVQQQPRDTIARCKAELRELGWHQPNAAGECAWCNQWSPCDSVVVRAEGYKHRSGYGSWEASS